MDNNEIEVGDVINFFGHFADEEKPIICVVAFDFHGYKSAFYSENERHRINEKVRIEKIGNVKTFEDLPENLLFAKHL